MTDRSPRVRPKDTASGYECTQSHNAVVAWLHSFRFRHLLDVFEAFNRESGGGRIRVLEIGCAHGKAFGLLDGRFDIDYVGIEPNEEFLAVARARYGERPNLRLLPGRAEDRLADADGYDIVLALETLEHIPERTAVRIVERIGAMRPALFVCSVPVEIGPAVWLKNVGSLLAGYARHKEYSWRETFWAGLYRLDRLPPHKTGHKGFDWRWLAQTVRHNMAIRQMRKFPIRFLPAALSTSVFIVASPRDTK